MNAMRPATASHSADKRAEQLLAWYDAHGRDLPWRSRGVAPPDPYRVWLSEIMLQQTTVATVKPYFARFLEHWPTIDDLAAAPLDQVMTAWAGLGYYARARNLHRCAQIVGTDYDGKFPANESELKALPGIGNYTAAAIAAIAFDKAATVVDGNVERVIARLFAIETPLPKAKLEISRLAATLTPQERAGDYAQAMMDLGATICTTARPKCLLCPLKEGCLAHLRGLAAELPRRTPKAAKPIRRAVAFWLERNSKEVFLRRRPPKGLLGGMMEVPSTAWREDPWSAEEAVEFAPAAVAWRPLPGFVRHTFTHFHFEITVWTGKSSDAVPARDAEMWCPIDRLAEQALPTVMRKVAHHAMSADEP